MTNWKDPALLLGLANTGGLVASFIYLLKLNHNLQAQIVEINNKYNELYKKIGGPNGQLYDFVTTKVINGIPTMEKTTTERFTKANKQLKKIRENNDDLANFLQEFKEFFDKNVIVTIEDEKERARIKAELDKLEIPKLEKDKKKKGSKKNKKKPKKKDEPDKGKGRKKSKKDSDSEESSDSDDSSDSDII
jgi:hypothetical protein